MDVTSVCIGQGSWSATSRHGQTTITEHPRPFRRNFRSVIPDKADTVVDTAQFQALFERGVPIWNFEELCTRQAEIDKRQDTYVRSFTTQLSLGCSLTQQWGVTPLTWDQSFKDFVSPSEQDVQCGSRSFEDALPGVANGSLILLDQFTEGQQERILQQLGTATSGKWVVLQSGIELSSARSRQLQQIGYRHDQLLTGHKLAAKALSWRTGDVSPAKLSNTSVWIPKYAEIPAPLWTEWLDSSVEHPGTLFSSLTQTAQDYWQRRQDGAYINTPGVLAACDGSADTTMGAAAVLRFEDGSVLTDSCRVDGPPSSFRSEAAGMHMALELAPRDRPLTIMTDSMNVLYAIRAFNTGEFARDMRR